MRRETTEQGMEKSIIPARSRRRAMDWSLVLASQEIPTVIEYTAESGWHLLVERQDLERSIAALRQYQRENRHWFWRRGETWPDFHFDRRAAFWCLLLVVSYLVEWQGLPEWGRAGVMNSALVRAGQWWRLFTAILLHLDLAHLTANIAFGFVLFGLAMAHYGAGVGLLAAYLAGVAGNVTGLVLYPQAYQSLGASGMDMGALGLIAMQAVFHWRNQQLHPRRGLQGAIAGLLLFILLGLDPSTDILAHLGGFAAGAILGGALAFAPPAGLRRFWIQALAGLVLALLVIGTAVLATV